MPRVLALAVLLAVAPAAAAPFDHSAWNGILQRRVDDQGRVAYRTLAAEDRAALDGYLAALAAADPAGWPRAEQIAFWINAYNATIVAAILEGYSAESVLSRYQLFARHTRKLAGRERTPDQIEKRILLGFGEPRVHFAIVCASSSCPRLRRQAWTGDGLDADLDQAARRFLADPKRNQVSAGADPIRLSMIFKWYQKDFGGSEDAVRTWVGRHSDDTTRRSLLEGRPAIEYLDYDWTMNAQPGERPG
jgi:Protein of unknown function, DUF547